MSKDKNIKEMPSFINFLGGFLREYGTPLFFAPILGISAGLWIYDGFSLGEKPENTQPKAVDQIVTLGMAAPVFTLGYEMRSSFEKNGVLIQSESRCITQGEKGCQEVLVDFRVGAETATNTALVKKDGRNYIVTWPTRDQIKAMTEINSLTGKLPKSQAAPN